MLQPTTKALLFLFLIGCSGCMYRVAFAESAQPRHRLDVHPAKAPIIPAVTWPPADVDSSIPPVNPNVPCSLPQVLSRTSRRIEQLTSNLNRFSATEIVEHHKVGRTGNLHRPEFRRFDYLVFLTRRPSGYMKVQEYRKRPKHVDEDDEFPDHVATEGTPTLVLLFHPKYAPNFTMTCEGLGQWHGKPAWQIHFEERNPRSAMIGMVVGARAFNLRIRGRAWILADSYQVAHLETDLAQTVADVHLRLDHQTIDYEPVRFPKSKVVIWLPASTELFMDFQGHRFYRRHSFSDFSLFSVKVNQQINEPE